MQKFTVQLLNDSEYDSLPYKGARESMGCADPEKGLAFVRQTGVPEIDMGTLEHEVNHLLEKHQGEHDLDGIYYKHKGNFFNKVFGGGGLGGVLGDVAAVALAPFTGGASLGYLPLASAAGGAIQNAVTGGNPLTGAFKGFGVGGLAAPVGGALLGATQGISSGLSGIGSGLLSGSARGANTFISGIPGFGAGGALSKATGLGGASFGTGAGTTPLASNVLAPGQAAANASAASLPGTTFSAIPSSTGLLGTTNAFNAATAAGTPAGRGILVPGTITTGDIAQASNPYLAPGVTAGPGTGVTTAPFLASAGGGLLGSSIANAANTPAMSLTTGGVGNAAGQPLSSTVGGGFAPSGIAGQGAPLQAVLPSTTANPVTGLPSTVAQQTPSSGAGITTASTPTTTGAATIAPSGGASTTTDIGANSSFFKKLLDSLETGAGLAAGGKLLAGAGLLGTSAAIPSPQFQLPASVGDLNTPNTPPMSTGNITTPGKTTLGGTIAEQLTPTGTVPFGTTITGTPATEPSLGGITTVGKQGTIDLSKILTTPASIQNPALAINDPYFASTFETIDQNFQNAKNQLDAAYNQVGQLGSGEYLDQLRLLTEQTAQDKNQIVAQENQRRFEIGQSQQYSAIKQALGVDDQTMKDLIGLTDIDVQTAALKYGARVSDIQSLRQQLGTLGTATIESGLGISNAPTIPISLFGKT